MKLDALRAQLPALSERRLMINLGLTVGEVDWDDLARFVREADQAGVKVAFWPELKAEDGRWPNARNLSKFRPFWGELVGFIERESLPVDTLVVDLELGLQVQLELQRRTAQGETFGAIAYLLDRINPALYRSAKVQFQGMVLDAHLRGLHVNLTSLPMVLDDFSDGDETLQMALDCPVQDVDWDEVSFQVYRTVYNESGAGLVGDASTSFGARVVYDYGVAAREKFGDRAALDLGVVGITGYLDPKMLSEDVAAAKAAGITDEHLAVYALDTIVPSANPGAWLHPDPEERVPAVELKVQQMREKLRSLDETFQN